MKSLAELEAIKNKMKNQMAMRKEDHAHATRIVVGMDSCGIAAGARSVLSAIMEEIGRRELEHVIVLQTGCLGQCRLEPMVEVSVPGREKVTYVNITPEKAARIVEEHIAGGRVVTEYTLGAE